MWIRAVCKHFLSRLSACGDEVQDWLSRFPREFHQSKWILQAGTRALLSRFLFLKLVCSFQWKSCLNGAELEILVLLFSSTSANLTVIFKSTWTVSSMRSGTWSRTWRGATRKTSKSLAESTLNADKFQTFLHAPNVKLVFNNRSRFPPPPSPPHGKTECREMWKIPIRPKLLWWLVGHRCGVCLHCSVFLLHLLFSWGMNPHEVNAFYAPTENLMGELGSFCMILFTVDTSSLFNKKHLV